MKKFAMSTVAVLAVATLLSACGSGSDTESAQLEGKTFTTQMVVIEGAESPAADRGTISVVFSDGSISINAGCNTLFGEATWSNGTISVPAGTLASTMMACSEPLMAQDQLLATFFSSNPTWTLAGDTLTIESAATSGISQIALNEYP